MRGAIGHNIRVVNQLIVGDCSEFGQLYGRPALLRGERETVAKFRHRDPRSQQRHQLTQETSGS